MEEKIRELLACYHLEIKRLYRGRGAWLCETDQGLKLLRVYHGSPKHLQWEMMVKACLRERGYVYIDQFMANQEGVYPVSYTHLETGCFSIMFSICMMMA